MTKFRAILLLCTLYTLHCAPIFARNARIYGYVVDQDNVGIELANVVVTSTDFPIGTTTNKNGYYELLLEEADTVVLHFSMIGYTAVQQRIIDLHEGDIKCESELGKGTTFTISLPVLKED